MKVKSILHFSQINGLFINMFFFTCRGRELLVKIYAVIVKFHYFGSATVYVACVNAAISGRWKP